jgi:hypothetical protein
MIAGKTKTGFEFSIEDGALDDWELLEVLADIDDGKTQKIGSAIKLLLGADQANALKEHCRNDEGRVPTSAMMAEMGEIFAELRRNKDAKN